MTDSPSARTSSATVWRLASSTCRTARSAVERRCHTSKACRVKLSCNRHASKRGPLLTRACNLAAAGAGAARHREPRQVEYFSVLKSAFYQPRTLIADALIQQQQPRTIVLRIFQYVAQPWFVEKMPAVTNMGLSQVVHSGKAAALRPCWTAQCPGLTWSAVSCSGWSSAWVCGAP